MATSHPEIGMSENGPNATVFRVPVIGPRVFSHPLLSLARPAPVQTGLCDCPHTPPLTQLHALLKPCPLPAKSCLLSVEVRLILQVQLSATSPTKAVLTSQKLIPSRFSFLGLLGSKLSIPPPSPPACDKPVDPRCRLPQRLTILSSRECEWL